MFRKSVIFGEEVGRSTVEHGAFASFLNASAESWAETEVVRAAGIVNQAMV
jgi:hypothetical protein